MTIDDIQPGKTLQTKRGKRFYIKHPPGRSWVNVMVYLYEVGTNKARKMKVSTVIAKFEVAT